MQLLPKWVLTNKYPSIYDSESFTANEMVAKVYGSMNQLIKEYNDFIDEINTAITEHYNDVNKDIECFERCVTEILEKYIKSIDMKIDEQNLKVDKIVLNLPEVAGELINEAIKDGRIASYESYNEATESLDILVTGGV
jgi:hypothetical protein